VAFFPVAVLDAGDGFFAVVFFVEDVRDVLRAAMGCAPCRWIAGL
jgi:hypothetical protein